MFYQAKCFELLQEQDIYGIPLIHYEHSVG